MSSESNEITYNIKDIIENQLDGVKYVNHEMDLDPTESLESRVMKAVVTIVNDKSEEKQLKCVAKTLPMKSWVWSFARIPEIFMKEVNVYATVIPTLLKFLRDVNMYDKGNFFAEYYGSNVNLDPLVGVINMDALILLEDLTDSGYETVNKFVGFDLHTSNFILEKLAFFHATCMAFKKDPRFRAKIVPYLQDETRPTITKDTLAMLAEPYKQYLDEEDFRKLKCSFKKYVEFSTCRDESHTLFFTVIHKEFSAGNIFVKYESETRLKFKMIDFQTLTYGPVAHDVLYFIYTSVELSVLEKHSENLFYYYHTCLMIALEQFGVNTDDYTKPKFFGELDAWASLVQAPRILSLLGPYYSNKLNTGAELTADDFALRSDSLNENFYPKLKFLIKEFSDRNWI